jgi:hypothetical protein
MDIMLTALGCTTVQAVGELKVTGSWTATNGKYVDNTTTTGSVSFNLAKDCLTISHVPVTCTETELIFKPLGWTDPKCPEDGKGGCNCTLKTTQAGGIGIISNWKETKGDYTTKDGVLNIDDTTVEYGYCVASNKLTLSPTQEVLPLKGTIVLEKSGGGTGGSTGTGGKGGTSGTTSSAGGTTSTGGKGGTTSSGSGGTSTAGGSGGSATGGTSTAGGSGGSATGGTTSTGSAGNKPCDILKAEAPCVAAHSTIRALFGSYNGPLYQVKRASDGTTKDITPMSPGGVANSSLQDTFCQGTKCTILFVYDQSGNGNDLEAETPDSKTATGFKNESAASATAEKLKVGGQSVYSLYTKPSQAYWHDGSKSKMPKGAEAIGVYMVTSGKHFNTGCCFDYGDSETTRTYVPGPSIFALDFTSQTSYSTGAGTGPWIMVDMEDGVFLNDKGGAKGFSGNPTQTATFVSAFTKKPATDAGYSIRGGDATTGKLATYWNGKLPGGKVPYKMQGALVMGSGGDCCMSNNNASEGTFYEGAVVAGYPSDATEDAIQENIIAAKYETAQ